MGVASPSVVKTIAKYADDRLAWDNLPAGTPYTVMHDGAASIAPVAGDLKIRDTVVRKFWLPVAPYRQVVLRGHSDTEDGGYFDQNLLVEVWAGEQKDVLSAKLAAFTVPNGADYYWTCGPGAVGLGGLVGTDPLSATYCWYNIGALEAGLAWVVFDIHFAVMPTKGQFVIAANRRS